MLYLVKFLSFSFIEQIIAKWFFFLKMKQYVDCLSFYFNKKIFKKYEWKFYIIYCHAMIENYHHFINSFMVKFIILLGFIYFISSLIIWLKFYKLLIIYFFINFLFYYLLGKLFFLNISPKCFVFSSENSNIR